MEAGQQVERNTESIAEAHYRMGEVAEAREIYGQLYRDGYSSFALLTNLANLLVRAGDYRGALALLEEALASWDVTAETEARLRHNIAYLQGKLDSD